MLNRLFSALLIAVFVPLVTIVGCSDSSVDTVVVSGKVTYAGTPVANGQILFTPVAGTRGPASGAHITDGNYIVDSKGGVPVGKHRVTIKAYRPDPHATPKQAREGLYVQYLPAKYNSQSTLEVTISADGNNDKQDFELEK